MTIDAQVLPPTVLALWTRTLRLASNLSQDALAEAAGLTTRTIQRVESGQRTSLTTRRSLARGLGYDNPGIFDDPEFAGTVTLLLESIKANQIKAEEARYPNHIKVAVFPTENGAVLGSLVDGADAWTFHCDEKASPEGQTEAAILFDHLQDYGDIWSELQPSGRLEAQSIFTGLLADVARHGLQAFYGRRVIHLAATEDRTPFPFTIAYMAIVPIERELSYIVVPKRG